MVNYTGKGIVGSCNAILTVQPTDDDATIKKQLLNDILIAQEEIGVTDFSHLRYIIIWNIKDC